MIFDEKWLTETAWLLVPFIIGVTIHEFAHARTALAFGDHTAYYLGRCTLNPLAHLDLWGTLILVATHFFGWGKPVPVNPLRLNPRALGDIMVSLAGPLSNLALAVALGISLRLLVRNGYMAGESGHFYINILLMIITMNVAMFAFNLIPLFPLDGHHILREMLPLDWHESYQSWQRKFGSIVLFILIFGPMVLSKVTNSTLIVDPLSWVFSYGYGYFWSIILY